MRSKMTIMAIVVAILLVCVGVLVGLIVQLGAVPGLLVGVAIALVVVAAYVTWIGPWQRRWNATDEEVARTMPGDGLLPEGSSTTRAITVGAPPERIWPWLVQLGYGRGGWYSYDWIDNDGQPSADRIVDELQHLAVGDRILMVPDLGPEVRAMEVDRYLLSGDAEGGVWCLALYPQDDGSTRLVSRWTLDWPLTWASAFWILISDPGAFVMERKMLRGIKERAERLPAPTIS
jgi:hypothetical protein